MVTTQKTFVNIELEWTSMVLLALVCMDVSFSFSNFKSILAERGNCYSDVMMHFLWGPLNAIFTSRNNVSFPVSLSFLLS